MLSVPDEIKNLVVNNSTKKNLRIHFPNGERVDITNDNLVGESFCFTESICSQKEIKFGLCEASVVEFECFGIENIKGCLIDVSHEIDISDLPEDLQLEYAEYSDDIAFPYYPIPYGRFIVDECPRNARNMEIRTVTAYEISTEGFADINPVEKAKRRIICSTITPYKVDAEKYFYSSIKGDYMIEGAMYTNLTLANSWHGYNNIFVVLGCSYTFADVAEQEHLYHIVHTSFYTVEKLRTEVYAWLEENLPDDAAEYLATYDFCAEDFLYPLYEFSDYNRGVRYPALLKNYKYLYPFANGVPSSNCSMSICIPCILEIRDEEGITLKSFELCDADNVNFQKVTLPTTLDPLWLSIDREKVKGGYTVQDATALRPIDVAKGLLELKGVFGLYRRDCIPEFVSLAGRFGLFPSDDLYPSDGLYPMGANAGTFEPSDFESVWFDDNMSLPYGKINAPYYDENGELNPYEYTIKEYGEGNYQTYDLSANYILQNSNMTQSNLDARLAVFAENVKDIMYMPADVTLAGRPWIEAGDVVTIVKDGYAFETIVMRRILKGIQGLKDSFESS